MRSELTRDRLHALMRELASTAPGAGPYRVFIVGGGTAVESGWRPSSVDVDLYSEQEEVFHDIQGIKERVDVNVEFARPEQLVPELPGSSERHVFIESFGGVSFYHYDPYAQLLAKIVRGFRRDVDDAGHFVRSGMVDPERFRSLVKRIPDAAYSRYPALSRAAVVEVVDEFVDGRPRQR